MLVGLTLLTRVIILGVALHHEGVGTEIDFLIRGIVELNILLMVYSFGIDYYHEVCCPRCWGRRRVRGRRRGRIGVGCGRRRRIRGATMLRTTGTLQTVKVLEVTYPEVVVLDLALVLAILRHIDLDDPYDAPILVGGEGRA